MVRHRAEYLDGRPRSLNLGATAFNKRWHFDSKGLVPERFDAIIRTLAISGAADPRSRRLPKCSTSNGWN